MPKTSENKDDKQTTSNNADDAIKQMEKLMFDLPTSSQESTKTTKKPCRACVDFKSWTKNLTGVQPKVILYLFFLYKGIVTF